MNTRPFAPPITHIVVFSGGGGLVQRSAEVPLEAGENTLRVQGVPASFDPETFVVTVPDDAELKQTVIRKPNRKYVEELLQREGNAARRIIDGSSEVGPRRADIIEICESIAQRTYLDEEVDLTLRITASRAFTARIHLSYFIDDARFRWKPTIVVEMDHDDGTVRVRGQIAITNDSAHHFENVEVSFADFARDLSDNATNFRAEPNEMKRAMRKRKMKNFIYK